MQLIKEDVMLQFMLALYGRLNIVMEFYSERLLAYMPEGHFLYYIMSQAGAFESLEDVTNAFGYDLVSISQNDILFFIHNCEIPALNMYLTNVINTFNTEKEMINVSDIMDVLESDGIIGPEDSEIYPDNNYQ